jgi:hypothetical protein
MNKKLFLAMTTSLVILVFLLGRYYQNRELPNQAVGDRERNTEFDRGKYIIDVDKGNSKSALILARYYGSIGITEAQLYWLNKANQMGDIGASKELIEACERSVFDEWRNCNSRSQAF